ncbi:magnesium-translocating P-type ATPase [Krasilnikovia sp. M28-CT-15]|uniref:magnesium-translocating P-type ATPase n=1 Tax=Krasilnikovia sp. M28-CT-15 TaxID=3373540 RepID=UPI003876E1CA
MSASTRVGAGHGEPFWAGSLTSVVAATGSGVDGLSGIAAAQRSARYGPNRLAAARDHRGWRLLFAQFTSPIMLILIVATVISMVLGDFTDGTIILVIIAASGGLGFWQEHSAGRAVDALLARVRVQVEVRRDGREISVPAENVTVGDVVVLRAGDIVPADCRVITSHALLVDEAALTGEPFPVDKLPDPVPADAPPAERRCALFAGTHVVSGAGTAIVVQTGSATEFAAVAAELAARDVTTGFERGMTAFGLLLMRAMVVLVAVIFAVNLVLHRPLVESLLFSLALAVGLTPQLLPAIVAVSLSAGARRMADERVIVKRLDAIEDFGAMRVLCTDKTGTLTDGAIRLGGAYDLHGRPDDDVLRLARLNAALQHGFPNPMDQAILADAAPDGPERCLDEVPYDFTRKRLSVLTVDAGTPVLITKGAVDTVLDVCGTARVGTETHPLASVRAEIQRRFEQLSTAGYRVIAVATRAMPGRATVTVADETDMTVVGLLAFHDRPKPRAAEAVADLAALGISVRMVTGDNRLAATQVAQQVGLTGPVLTGAEIDRLSDTDLAAQVARIEVFAEVEPLHKQRLVAALRADGSTVGFLGDGINDAAALHTADVGISVDTAVDVAKQSAAIVLLDKDLAVVADGVRLGRQTFANTLKYVRVTTSANFGNMLSMAAAAAFLPFLPLLPRQILLLNFLTDIPGTTIATDTVDPEQVRRPRTWNIASIRTFMLVFGALSSVFDIATFLVLRWGFHAPAAFFRTGWFVESAATELVVMLVLRTSRPFFRSRPGRALLASSAGVAAIILALPYTPLAGPLGLTPLPATILAVLGLLTGGYVAANEMVKRRFAADTTG